MGMRGYLRAVPSCCGRRLDGGSRAGLALLALAMAASAQDPPVFEAVTTLMEVEVRATDGRGRPVADLSKEDFELFENNQLQEIATFEFVPGIRPQSPMEADAPPPETITSGSGFTVEDLRRSAFILVATRGRREDRIHIVNAIRGFLDDNLEPGVFISIEGSPFTTNKQALIERLEQMLDSSGPLLESGGLVDTLTEDLAREFELDSQIEEFLAEANEGFGEQVEEMANRAGFYRRLRMYEYIDLIRALQVYPGKKIVVLFSSGLAMDDDNLDILKVLEDEATRARVRFFVSDVNRLSAALPAGDASERGGFSSSRGDASNDGFSAAARQRQDSQDGLYELARATGGRAVLNSNDLGEVFEVATRESSNYYLLGYYPHDPEQRGRMRRLRVRSKRPGVKVSHQRRYFEERPFEMMSSDERNWRMHQALMFDTPYADLPLRVDHEFFRDSTSQTRVVFSIGLHTADLPAVRAKNGQSIKLTMMARASPVIDEEGGDSNEAISDLPVELTDAEETAPLPRETVTEGSFQTTLPSSEFERLSKDPNEWLHFGAQMPLDPGKYDWKVVVRDDHSGSLGSYQTRLHIHGPTDQLDASTLLLTSRVEAVDERSAKTAKKQSKNGTEDVLHVGANRFYATSTKVFFRGSVVYLLYDVYNPGAETLENPPGPLLALYRGSEPVGKLPVAGHQTVLDPEANRLRYLAALATEDLPVGDYTLLAMLPAASDSRPVIARSFKLVQGEVAQ